LLEALFLKTYGLRWKKDKKSLRNLKEAQPEAESTDVRYSHEEVFSDLRSKLIDRVDGDNT